MLYGNLTILKREAMNKIGQVLPQVGQERLLTLAKAALMKKAANKKTPTLKDIKEAVSLVFQTTDKEILSESKDQRELTQALLWCDTKAGKLHLDNSNTKNLINSVLAAFRTHIAKPGAHKLPTSFVTVVMYYGTIKDLNSVSLQWFDCYNNDMTSPVSKRTAERIRAYVQAQGGATFKEFKKYSIIYDSYSSILPIYLALYDKYFNYTNRATMYLYAYEWAKDAKDASEQLSLAFRPLMESIKVIAAKEIPKKEIADEVTKIETVQKKLEAYNKKFKGGDAFRYVSSELIPNYITPVLTSIKAVFACVENFAQKHDPDYLFLPYRLRMDMADPTATFKSDNIDDRYYTTYIKDLEAQGKPITEKDREKAIFPVYDDVGINEADAEYTKQVIDDEYNKSLRELQ